MSSSVLGGPGMASPITCRKNGLRLHCFVAGAVPMAAYLLDWASPVWIVMCLSAASLVSVRLAVVARLYDFFKTPKNRADAEFHYGVHRFNEAVRVGLLGLGLGLLLTGYPFGWLPILAASATALLEAATGFSVTALIYAGAIALVGRLASAKPKPFEPTAGRLNPDCLICRALGRAPYQRCRWCRLPSVRWCCGLQASMLLMLLLVIAFLLDSPLGPFVTKVLVAMSILAVVALGLAINRQTDDLVSALDDSFEKGERKARRCAFLKRLAAAHSVEAAAQTTVDYVGKAVGARRISVMIAEEGVLRIVASRGLPLHIAEKVEVPLDKRICGRVFSTGRAVLFHDVMTEMPALALGLEGAGASASLPLITAPMGANGDKVGCINVTDKPERAFSESDTDEMEFVAEATAISLAGQLAHRQLEKANYDTIRALALAMEAKDPCTHGHSLRVQAWCAAIGRELGFGKKRLQALSCAAELHDIGKLAIPDGILQAERPLTDAEWVLIRQHPSRGVQLIEHIGFLKLTKPIMLYHHERIDGGGYPEGRSGDEIPLESRILAVVDSYDAMTSARPYRPALTHEVAAAELRRCGGAQFDAGCVEMFLGLLSKEDAASVPINIGAERQP